MFTTDGDTIIIISYNKCDAITMVTIHDRTQLNTSSFRAAI